MPYLTGTDLKTMLRYDPETGQFTWLLHRNSRVRAGHVAGSMRPNGYIQIHLNGRFYRAHRLAWLYVHGQWPAEIDHINGDRSDNRICNLRLCTRSQNRANAVGKLNSVSGAKGVKALHGKWAARIRVDGRDLHLGLFTDKADASRAYLDAARRHFGEFAKA